MIYAIVGMGKSGSAARRFLLRSGVSPEDVVTFDEKAGVAEYHNPEQLILEKNPDVLVVSPGVPLTSPWLVAAYKDGKKITSEISLACADLRDEKIIGITGSVGKSTTVALLGEGAKVKDPHPFIGGNFGTPLCDYAADVREGRRPRAQWLILELSSFQLENCDGLNLDLAAITYLGANHMERYPDLVAYYKTKFHIAEICHGITFLNSRGGDLKNWVLPKTGQFAWADKHDPSLKKYRLENSQVLGDHQQDNLAVAACLALEAQWGDQSIDAMKGFTGLPHRLENLGEKNGVRYVNDSKATAIESVLIAAESCRSENGSLYLLLGGKDKNLPWQNLAALKSASDIKPIFFGECGAIAQKASGLDGQVFVKLSDAIAHAKQKAKSGDTVLLSPGGSSLDEFKNFEMRGKFFAEKIYSP